MLNNVTTTAVRTEVMAPWGLLDTFEVLPPAESREAAQSIAAPQPMALRLVSPSRFGLSKWGKTFRRELFQLFFDPMRDGIGREWITCPECEKEVLAHRSETGPSSSLRGCGDCGAVFLMVRPAALSLNDQAVSHVC